MTTKAPSKKWLARRDDWIRRVDALVNEVEQWAMDEEWSVLRKDKLSKARRLGNYDAAVLRIRTFDGELFLTPITVDGVDGHVDLEAWPTLHRAVLAPDGSGWRIITDSNVPVREPWNRETFLRLVRDLQKLT